MNKISFSLILKSIMFNQFDISDFCIDDYIPVTGRTFSQITVEESQTFKSAFSNVSLKRHF